MPIVDVEVVCDPAAPPEIGTAQRIADEVGRRLAAPKGSTWVRLRWLAADAYAENEAAVGADELPVFALVLHKQPPQGSELEAQVVNVTQAIALALQRSPERVHVQYAPPAAGRQAFGGQLVR